MQKIRRKYEKNRLFDCHVRGTICSLNEKRPWLNGITLRGRRRRRRQKGCISPAHKGGWPVFHRAKPGCKGFIHTGGKAAHHNPQRQSRCQTLAPLEPSARRAVNPYARQGVSLKPQTPAGIRHSAPPTAGRPPSLPQKKMEPCVMHSSIILHPMKAIILP